MKGKSAQRRQDKRKPLVERIEDIERRHPNEWLVIQVVEEDELSEPTQGILVARAQNHDEAWDLAMDVPGDVLVEFAGPPVLDSYKFIPPFVIKEID
jgi:hypothetical protein